MRLAPLWDGQCSSSSTVNTETFSSHLDSQCREKPQRRTSQQRGSPIKHVHQAEGVDF